MQKFLPSYQIFYNFLSFFIFLKTILSYQISIPHNMSSKFEDKVIQKQYSFTAYGSEMTLTVFAFAQFFKMTFNYSEV